jgi:hypothetical protein
VDGRAEVRCPAPQGDEVRTWVRDEEAKLEEAVEFRFGSCLRMFGRSAVAGSGWPVLQSGWPEPTTR